MTVERLVRLLISRSLPDRVAGDAADDLIADHRRVRATSGRLTAALFLIREGLSLVLAFLLAALARLARSVVILRRDLTQAVRALVRRPWSSAGAVLMLAAGLAAVTASSGLAASLLFRPINGRLAGAVYRLASADQSGRVRLAFSEVELERVRASLPDATAIATANLQPVVLRIGDTDVQTLAEVVGGHYFDLIGLSTALGRPLLAADAVPSAPPQIVISEKIWRRRFARDPSVLGTIVRLNGRAFTIAGVTAGASNSSLLGASVDAWITLAHADAMLDRNWRTNPDNRWWTTLVHAEATAAAEMTAALARATVDLASQLPEPWRERKLITLPGTLLAGSQRNAAVTLSLVLTLFAGLILVAAAANVGGLFLAAAAADRGRAAIHLAIGSGRLGILRRHLIEGALIGCGAGAAALAIYGVIRIQLAEVTLLPTLTLSLDLPLDAQLAALTVAGGGLVGSLLALGPALWITRLDVAQTLRDGSGRSSGGAGLSRARRILVAAQVAISITLLAGATLFARSVATLGSLDIGFPRHGLIALDFDLEPSAPSAAMLPVLAREALDRAQAVPGVVAAAMSNRAPIDSSTPAISVRLPGADGRLLEDVTFYLATERYFETVGVSILHGRAFTAGEVSREDDVTILNETIAKRLWPDGDAIDRAIVLEPRGRTVRVVGVARDSKYRSLSETARPHLYLPTAPSFSRALLVRTNDDPRRAILDVQAALDQVGPGVVGFFPRTLDDHVAIDMLPTRAAARAAATLGGLALLLSGAGLYGIVMWFVELRRREIAVRVALGASANDVRRLVVSQAVKAAAPGLVIGLVVAIALTFLGRSLFVGIGAVDPMSLLFAAGVLVAIVIVASYLPSRRATRVDPGSVLRST